MPYNHDRRIAVVCDHSQDNVDLAVLTAMNRWEYTALMGYDLITNRETWQESKMGSLWKWIKRTGSRDYDYILHVGSDFVFTNPQIPIDTFIDDAFGIVLSDSLATGYPICNDVCLWHNNHAGHYVVNALLDRVVEAQHERYLFQTIMAKLCGLLDGPADPLFKAAVKILPQRSMNSHPKRGMFGSWQPGDFGCHCSTGDKENKKNNVQTIQTCIATGAVPVERVPGQEGKG